MCLTLRLQSCLICRPYDAETCFRTEMESEMTDNCDDVIALAYDVTGLCCFTQINNVIPFFPLFRPYVVVLQKRR